MPDPRELAEKAEQAERRTRLPDGANERFAGYGVMGLPFSSGHVLGLRPVPRLFGRSRLHLDVAPEPGSER